MPQTRATHKTFEMKRTVEWQSIILFDDDAVISLWGEVANKQLLRSSSEHGGTSVCHIVKSVLLQENKFEHPEGDDRLTGRIMMSRMYPCPLVYLLSGLTVGEQL